jgi:predicted AlkP superfamily phosphohydrolase/phosphomutase
MRLAGARLLDLAPTILHLLDVPIPAQFEGRVLVECGMRNAECGFNIPPTREIASPTPLAMTSLPFGGPQPVIYSALSCKVMVLGLDGATWDLLEPLMAAGYLPNLAALRDRAAWGRLRSTTPPFSATAWTTFATGVNPGGHGIFDYWTGGREARTPISSLSVGAATLWRRLSEAGRRVAVVNVPVTYPPQPVNGVLVSGMMTPGEDAAYTYPPELKEQLRIAAGGDYRADPHAAITQSKAFLRDALRWVEQCERGHLWLWQREPWDCFINVIQAPDPIQHYFWTFLQPDHPDYHAAGAAGFRELALEVFRAIDRLIGRRLEMLDGRTVLMLMSDHGAGEATHWFNLNRWLAQEGWLVQQPGFSSKTGVLGAQLWNALRRLDVLRLRGRIGNLARQRLRARVDRLLAPAVDWRRTVAYAGSPSAEAIYVNLAGREPAAEGASPADVCEEIRRRLLALRGPDGGPVVEAVHRREEIYRGRFLAQAPDLVLEIGRRPYSISENLAAAGLFERIPFQAGRGRHRPEGILLLHGPAVGPAGERPAAHIADLCPTILHLLGLPVPAELDGRVLADWLDPAWPVGQIANLRYPAEPVGQIADLPYSPVAPAETSAVLSPDAVYSPEDVAIIEERLRSLGYLD